MDARVVVDASVWVSALKLEDVHNLASSQWITRYTLSKGLMIAPNFLFIELAAGIARPTGDANQAKEGVKRLEVARSINSLQIFPLNSAFIRRATHVAIDLRLRAGDATYVALAHQLNIPLISWDKEQLERGSSVVTTYTPDTYVFEADEEETETEA